jgi:hypothetical protein
MGSFFAPTLRASFFVASLFFQLFKKNSSNTKNETHKNTFLIKHYIYGSFVVVVVVVRALLGSQRDNARRDI